MRDAFGEPLLENQFGFSIQCIWGLAFSTVSYFTERFKFNPLEVVSCADGMQLNQIGLIPPTIISPKGKF